MKIWYKGAWIPNFQFSAPFQIGIFNSAPSGGGRGVATKNVKHETFAFLGTGGSS